MKQYPALAIVISIIAGLVIGILDMIMGYAPLPHIIVLVGAAILSAFNIKKSWIIAFILGGSIPVIHMVGKVIGIMPPYEFTSLDGFLVPIGLAFGGSMIGVRVSAGWMKTPFDTVSEEEQE